VAYPPSVHFTLPLRQWLWQRWSTQVTVHQHDGCAIFCSTSLDIAHSDWLHKVAVYLHCCLLPVVLSWCVFAHVDRPTCLTRKVWKFGVFVPAMEFDSVISQYDRCDIGEGRDFAVDLQWNGVDTGILNTNLCREMLTASFFTFPVVCFQLTLVFRCHFYSRLDFVEVTITVCIDRTDSNEFIRFSCV